MELLGLVDVPFAWALLIVGLTLFYVYYIRTYGYFRNRGIPGPSPWPFFGNTLGVAFSIKMHTWKQIYGNVYGIFIGREPSLVVTDLDMLKEILVKKFDNFKNRRPILFVPYPMDHGVFALEDDDWKRVRSIMSPTFSSGKLRKMNAAMNDCASMLTDNLAKAFGNKDGIDVQRYFGAFTMDAITQTSFGIKVDSQNDFNNAFINNAKQIFRPSTSSVVLTIMGMILPPVGWVFRKMNIGLISSSVTNFFAVRMRDMVKQREEEPVKSKRTDFLQLLMDAEIQENGLDVANGSVNGKSTHKRLTMDEILGQGILFFIAGYETTASTLVYISYNFAMFPEVQDNVYRELLEELGDEEPDYDNIQKLKYMENVILESLRLYPSAPSTTRRALETTKIGNVTIEKGMTVHIPIYAIHRDPEVYHNPEEFIPERHNEKDNPLSFLSFGYGPRVCLGMRLALYEMKMALVHVVRKVKFSARPDTPRPGQLKLVQSVSLRPAQPIILNISPRT